MKQKLIISVCSLSTISTWGAPSGILYVIGSPTAKEQLHVELINRSRANPPLEGIRLDGYKNTEADIAATYTNFAVNLTTMKSEFNAIPVAQPLSINEKLLAAARLHSQYQIDSDQQTHVGLGGTTTGQRITAQGYSWAGGIGVAENVYVSSKRPLYGHASFNVDWGNNPPSGMQAGRGHRTTLHNDNYREVGVANLTSAETTIYEANVTAVGPEVVTQDFATASGATPFITGVVYFDLNSNSFYDIGEGVGGVAVGVTGSTYYAVTAASGGYSVPVPGNGNYPVEFWLPGASSASFSTSVTVAGLKNAKLDWTPTYTAPVLSGNAAPPVGAVINYPFTTVPAATSYKLKANKVLANPAGENADSGSSGYTITPGYFGYLVVAAFSGSNAFHFGNAAGGYSAPALTLNRKLVPKTGSTSTFNFKSRLRTAQTSQIAKVQVLAEGEVEWKTLWSQAGVGAGGEAAYQNRSVNLDAYDGREIQLRMIYDWSFGNASGSWTTSTVGWWVDDITFSNIDELTSPVVSMSSTSPGQFAALTAGPYRLTVQPLLLDSLYPPPPSAQFLMNAVVPTSGYYAWSYFPTVGAPESNYDGDNSNNLLEYAFDTNPVVVQTNVVSVNGATVTRGAPTVQITNVPGGVDYRVLFCRRTDATGLSYLVQFSGDMVVWEDSLVAPTVLVTDGDVQAVTVPYPFFVNGKKARYFQVIVTLTP